GNNYVNLFAGERAQNRFSRVPLFVVNFGVEWKLQLCEGMAKLLCDGFIVFADINQMKISGEVFVNAFRFRKNLFKPRRERARHGDGFVWHWFPHWTRRLPSCLRKFRQMRLE